MIAKLLTVCFAALLAVSAPPPAAQASAPVPIAVGVVSINGVIAFGYAEGLGIFPMSAADYSAPDLLSATQSPGSIQVKYIDDKGDEIVVFMGCNLFSTYLACAEAAGKLVEATKKIFPPAKPAPKKEEETKK